MIHRKTLSENELELLKLLCSELTYKEIAARMFKAVRTVEGYRDALFVKLETHTRQGLMMWAVDNGVYEPKKSRCAVK